MTKLIVPLAKKMFTKLATIIPIKAAIRNLAIPDKSRLTETPISDMVKKTIAVLMKAWKTVACVYWTMIKLNVKPFKAEYTKNNGRAAGVFFRAAPLAKKTRANSKKMAAV